MYYITLNNVLYNVLYCIQYRYYNYYLDRANMDTNTGVLRDGGGPMWRLGPGPPSPERRVNNTRHLLTLSQSLTRRTNEVVHLYIFYIFSSCEYLR